ncbi:hypothetical protein I3842_04G120000 [Carya illinoinensis]|uniref:Secreted protein n=1 Tax=Carya illinoinensis TaxID=32201 RepID=A0A922F8D1_CARIL|nr:hypothetical protein I3842_04G120000 [Carya illinoinensis]
MGTGCRKWLFWLFCCEKLLCRTCMVQATCVWCRLRNLQKVVQAKGSERTALRECFYFVFFNLLWEF